MITPIDDFELINIGPCALTSRKNLFAVPITCYATRRITPSGFKGQIFSIEKSKMYATWIRTAEKPDDWTNDSYMYRKEILDNHLTDFLYPGGLYETLPENPELSIGLLIN